MYKCMTVPRMADAIEPADSNFSKKSLDSFSCGDTCSVTDDTIISFLVITDCICAGNLFHRVQPIT